jgi:TonB-linked SusC/RagA family outer membrane protein
MLQGQLAGVVVSSNGGDPTGTPNIVIRGQGSQNGDNVLWVVDGVPGAPIASMNDIESIVVLKDAASAAIYGAQSGAGGVVLVTTKKAKEGAPSLSYDATFGIRQAMNLIEPLNAEEQLKMRQLSYANAGLSLPAGWDVSKNPWVGTTRTDWMDEIFRTGFYQRHNVALNVGTENYSNRLSFAFDQDEGVLENTFDKHFTLRYNGKFKLNKWVTISEDLIWKNHEDRSVDTNSGYTGAVIAAMFMPASATVYNPLDGTYGGTTTEDPAYIAQYGSNFADAHGDAVNPMRLLEAHNRYDKTSEVWSTTSLEIANIVPGLKFTSRFTYSLEHQNYKNFSPIRDEVGKPELSNSLNNYSYRTDAWKTENTLTYDNTFNDKHTVGVLLSTTADHYAMRGLEVDGKDFADESSYLQYLSYAGSTTAYDFLTGPDANVSLIGRLAYSYDDRYFLTASWRRDYAGRLPKDNNYGDFPALTAAWKISNEAFFPENDVVNLLKVRASWGRVGNLGSIGYNYKSAVLKKSSWSEQAQYGPESGKVWENFVYNGVALNPNLTWETSEQWDLGIDLDMFNDRLNIAVDYYDKLTYNLIQSQTMGWTGSIGLDAMLVNQGKIRNRGAELTIGWSDQVGDWSYYVNANYSFNKNTVEDIGIKDAAGNSGLWVGGGEFGNLRDYYQTCEGGEVNSFYLIECAGIFQSIEEIYAHQHNGKLIQPNAQPGDLKFVDYNNDGVINNSDKQYWGNWMPHSNFALSAGFTWKGLSASMMLQGVAGAKAFYPGKLYLVNEANVGFNRSAEILNAWTPENTNTVIPRLTTQDPNGNFATTSTWYLEDASYVRIKNVTVGYDFTNLLRKAGHFDERGSRLSVYFSGENLFTFTKYSGMDPEVNGYDAVKYPVSRVLSLGVKLTY